MVPTYGTLLQEDRSHRITCTVTHFSSSNPAARMKKILGSEALSPTCLDDRVFDPS